MQENSSLLPNSVPEIHNTFPLTVPSEHLTAPLKAKRGRPRKNQPSTHLGSITPNIKRQKLFDKLPYLCPDCRSPFADDRWSEHVKRTHFPSTIWKCPQWDSATGEICRSKPFYRSGNFGDHLKAKHGLGVEEIVQLKIASKLAVVNFFHHRCGFSGCNHEPFQNRNESIEHIKLHFKEVAQQANPPDDMGASQWEHKCACSHELTRGVHYHVAQVEDGHDDDDEDDNDDDGPGNDSSLNQQPDNSKFLPDSGPPPGGDDDPFEPYDFDTDFSDYIAFGQHSSAPKQDSSDSDVDVQQSKYTVYGLEQFLLPFTTLRILGVGGHGLVHEVVDKRSAETFARKSVRRKSKEPAVSSRLFHLKNELSILKKLSHSHIVKVIGAYADSEYAHIIISPVADQNLAGYLSRSIGQGQLVRWMDSLASATSYLHANGVLHLDIKPENMLLKGENILLADFGTAKYFTELTAELDEYLAITPMYCAPEIMLHRRQEYASDLFSLGCVFSEMITRYFGYSVDKFECFRADHGSKAFYLTIPAVKEWVTLLPRYTRDISAEQRPCQLFDPQRKLHQTICQMLDGEPSARPKASDLQFDFSDTGYCSEHGKVWVNNSSSALGEHHSVEPIFNPSLTSVSSSSASNTKLLAEVKSNDSCNSSQSFLGHTISTTSYDAQKYLGTIPSSFRCSEPQNHGDSTAENLTDTHCIEEPEEDYCEKFKILENLKFTGMNNRYENIPRPHEKTFEWIFANNQEKYSWNSFSEWLRSDSSIYWVQGKPGSGKSTLMKFITDNHKTKENLHFWSGKSPLIVASAFLGNSGTPRQRSMIGLLRTLLYTTMKYNSELAKTAFSDRWKSYKSHNRSFNPWSTTELAQVFNIMILDNTQKFCFFVDGLDEYDGDHQELSNLIVSLSTKSNVKICVSSRPLVPFVDAFQEQPSIRLQDLTERDIRVYVAEKLGENKRFAQLRDEKPQDAKKLVHDIKEKASGVFLWVHLAVNSLLRGLENHNDMTDLQRRLRELPPELEALYSKLDPIDAGLSDSSETANEFQMMILGHDPIWAENCATTPLRALCDTGSPANFISQSGLDKIGLYTARPIPVGKLKEYTSPVNPEETIVPREFVRLMLLHPTVGLHDMVDLKIFDIPADPEGFDVILGRGFLRNHNDPLFLSKVTKASAHDPRLSSNMDNTIRVILNGKTPKSKFTHIQTDENGWTSLNMASWKKHTNIIKFPLEKGAELESKHITGNQTPLACISEYHDIYASSYSLTRYMNDFTVYIPGYSDSNTGHTIRWSLFPTYTEEEDSLAQDLDAEAKASHKRRRAAEKGHADGARLLLELSPPSRWTKYCAVVYYTSFLNLGITVR